jgi:hypothetical protein
MRRLAVLLPIAVLAAALLARRRRHRSAAPLAPVPRRPAAAPLPAAPRFVSVPWTLVEAPEDRPELTIRHRGARHAELDRIDAQETPTQVFVTALMAWRPPAGGDAAAWEEEHEATVSLSRPLGGRELLHAPVDDDVPDDPPLYP